MKAAAFIITSLFIFNSVWAESPEDKGLSIVKKTDAANEGFAGEKSNMEMTLINAHGDQIVRKMSSKTKETKNDGDKSIVTFHWPADVKGTKMLTWTHKTSDDDQWLFLPALRRVKRISSRSKTGSFMGSEFSYEDLGSQEVEKYTYKYIKDEKIKGRDCWLIERYPVDKKSGYSKQEVWMDKEYNNASFIKYYDRKKELLKTAEFTEFKQHGKYWRANQIKMDNLQTKKSSILKWSDRTLGEKFADREFRKNELKK